MELISQLLEELTYTMTKKAGMNVYFTSHEALHLAIIFSNISLDLQLMNAFLAQLVRAPL